jgi:hypothetical protein
MGLEMERKKLEKMVHRATSDPRLSMSSGARRWARRHALVLVGGEYRLLGGLSDGELVELASEMFGCRRAA